MLEQKRDATHDVTKEVAVKTQNVVLSCTSFSATMSSLIIFKKKNKRSQIFILGSAGVGKSSLLHILCNSLSMTDKGTQTVAGIELETIKSAGSIIYSYNFDKSNFSTMTKFITQSSTKCVIFVVDSRKQHIIKDSHGNDIRSNIKAIGKVVSSGTFWFNFLRSARNKCFHNLHLWQCDIIYQFRLSHHGALQQTGCHRGSHLIS